MASEQRVRELRDPDVPAVVELLHAEWPAVDWRRRFERLWRDNPTFGGTTHHARGFVFEDGPTLRGFFGSIPVRYQVDGRDGVAAAATSLCVRPDSRGRGIAAALVAAFDGQTSDAKINATPNAASAPLFERLGYRRIDPAAGRRLLAHANQPFAALRKAWRARGRGMLRALLTATRRVAPPPLRCERLPAATAELDALWAAHRTTHPTTLWRDRAALQWLLFGDPTTAVIGCRGDDGALRGHGAFRIERGELRQIDAFPANDDDVAISLALAGAAEAARCGVATVRLLAVPATAAPRLTTHGFEPVADDLVVQARGIDPANAWLTRLDGDRWA